jgi:hypothetical protein
VFRVSKCHLERAVAARDNKATWNCITKCILGQALKARPGNYVGFETVDLANGKYKLEQPIGREIQKAFIWERCRSMLPVSIKLTPVTHD